MQLIAMFRFESRLLLRCLVFVGHRFGISSVLSFIHVFHMGPHEWSTNGIETGSVS